MKKFIAVIVLSVSLIPSLASAHQPRLVTSPIMVVSDPEISKAYYGILNGEDSFIIDSATSFNLYANILLPDREDSDRDIKFVLIKDNAEVGEVLFDSGKSEWKKFSEPFGHDDYLQGAEFKQNVKPGVYRIVVESSKPDTRYSLAIGEIESFDFKETVNTIKLIPTIKKEVFGKNPADFILSPIGAGYIVVMFTIAFIFGFAYRFILKLIAKKRPVTFIKRASKNINKSGRLLRLIIGIGLLILAITTNWSAILIFFSGFAIFESIFSWCGFNALIGRNTCEVA